MTVFLNVIGLIFNIIGTIILAFSLSTYLRSIRLAIDAHEVSILSLGQNQLPKVVVTGTDKHMDVDKQKSNICTKAGVIIVLLGFIFQLIAIFTGLK